MASQIDTDTLREWLDERAPGHRARHPNRRRARPVVYSWQPSRQRVRRPAGRTTRSPGETVAARRSTGHYRLQCGSRQPDRSGRSWPLVGRCASLDRRHESMESRLEHRPRCRLPSIARRSSRFDGQAKAASRTSSALGVMVRSSTFSVTSDLRRFRRPARLAHSIRSRDAHSRRSSIESPLAASGASDAGPAPDQQRVTFLM